MKYLFVGIVIFSTAFFGWRFWGVNAFEIYQLEKQISENLEESKRVGIEMVRSSLKDPTSAQFSKVTVSDIGIFVCGYVNAKNSFGGYVGPTRFAVVVGQGKVLFEGTADKDELEEYYGFCTRRRG